MKRVYLDHNATTQPHPDVFAAMVPYLREVFGNPSSIHWFGQEARRAVDRARQQVADLIGAGADEVVFVSGGTESNNQAIRGLVANEQGRPLRIVTSSVEHPAVLNTCRDLEHRGVRVAYLPVNGDGLIDLQSVTNAITGDTVLVTVMLANNDVGTIQPIQKVAEIVKRSRTALHTDAVQAVGKIPVNVRELGVDLLSVSGHKIYGPKGIGALYIRRGTKIAPLIHGGHHESARRAGTENVPAIVGFGKACEIAREELGRNAARLTVLRNRLEKGILGGISDTQLNGHPESRLPNTSNVSFSFVDGESLVMNLDLMGIAVSTGSACTSSTSEPSHVLTAMGRSAEEARSSVRFSLGETTTAEDVDATVEVLVEVVDKLRERPLSC